MIPTVQDSPRVGGGERSTSRPPGNRSRFRFSAAPARNAREVAEPHSRLPWSERHRGRWGDLFETRALPSFDRLASVARRILGRDDLACDAVQEALLSLWMAPDRPPNPGGWLVRAVVHRGLSIARSRARRRKHEDLARLDRAEESDRDDPASRMEQQEFRDELETALGQLEPEFRNVFMLRHVDELDYREIAQELGIPVGTVRSRLSRSRAALRDRLSPTTLEG